MTTGRPAYMPEPGRLEYVIHELPEVAPDGVLVRVTQASIRYRRLE